MPSETREQKELTKTITLCIKQFTEDKEFICSLARQVSKEVLTKINERLAIFEDKFTALQKVTDGKILEQENKIKSLEEKINSLNYRNEILEQRSHVKTLRIHGIEEAADGEKGNLENELIKIFNHKLKVNMQLNDIEYCYRMGKKDSKKPRPIIVNMFSYKIKQKVFAQKKAFKNTGISMYEELTRTRAMILKKAIEMYGKRNVWTNEGKIYVKNGTYIRHIKSENELYETRTESND